VHSLLSDGNKNGTDRQFGAVTLSSKMLTHTGCPRRNVPDFGRVFLMLKYTDITQNTYAQS